MSGVCTFELGRLIASACTDGLVSAAVFFAVLGAFYLLFRRAGG